MGADVTSTNTGNGQAINRVNRVAPMSIVTTAVAFCARNDVPRERHLVVLFLHYKESVAHWC